MIFAVFVRPCWESDPQPTSFRADIHSFASLKFKFIATFTLSFFIKVNRK